MNALGFGSVFVSSYLATCLANSEKHADLGSHLLPLMFFPIGTIAIVAEFQDTGRPYKLHLVYGYEVRVSLLIFFRIESRSSNFLARCDRHVGADSDDDNTSLRVLHNQFSRITSSSFRQRQKVSSLGMDLVHDFEDASKECRLAMNTASN